jgi:tetratricopeptide (TPR) repeat protein
MFRHALLRDAAYASLLRAGRASAHRAVAQALMAVDADSAGRRPELLARHHQEAGETVVARELWMRAGDRSAREAGFREAAAHYRAALRLLGTEAPTTQRDIVELRLQNRLGHMLAQGEGYASAPMLDCFVRSRTLALRMNDLETFTAASAGVGGVLLAQGRPDEVEALFEAPAGTDPSALSSNNRLTRDAILAITMSLRGDQRRAWPLMQAARAGLLAEWSGAGSPVGLAFRLVNLLAHAAYSALCQGRFIEADALTHEALERALETKHGVACAYALGARAAVLADMGRASEGQSLAQRALDLALTHDLKPWITLARLGLGLIANDRGEIDEDGLARHRASLDDWRHEQGAFHCGEFCAQMAERLLRAGRARQAEDYVALGESIFRDLSERVYAAELLRLRGHLQELEGDWVEAERQYREAIELADRQGADRLALRAAASLSRLWLAQGQPERVPVFLAPRLENSLMPRSNPEWLSARELFERARAAP